jgi:heat shock protein HtpX
MSLVRRRKTRTVDWAYTSATEGRMAQSSIVFRAALAVALMIGFYVLAIIVAAFLFMVPWLQTYLLGRVFVQLSLASVISGCIILWSILPRPDRFNPPGPRLEATSQPELFQVIEAVARSTGQPTPEDVYLIPDVNAWVAQRGGMMGFGSRPVMGLGLSLLQLLTVAQLRAVLAHEFGHFHGGDTRLAPWVYKTRAAIGRTLAGLGERAKLVHIPFEIYGNFFLLVTHGVSRRQELNADAMAARVEGARALAEGLKITHGAAPAFAAYWQTEVAPLLQAGVLPPLADGLGRFVAAGTVSEKMRETVESDIREGRSDPYDTHPPLRERLEALGTPEEAAGPSPAAISLLRGVPELERALLRFGRVNVDGMRAIAWEDVGERVLRPWYRSRAEAGSLALAGFVAERLPEVAGRIVELDKALDTSGEVVAEGTRRQRGAWFLGVALADALARAGWVIDSSPGRSVRLTHGQWCIEPFMEAQALVRGRTSPDEWRGRCEMWEIKGLVLAERPSP